MLNSKNKDTLVVSFSHLQERFRRFAVRILPNEEDAEDALQEAFCPEMEMNINPEKFLAEKAAEAVRTLYGTDLGQSALQVQVTRKEFEGDDYDRIASDLHMQPTAVRVQLSRALKIIRELYRKMEEKGR